MSNHFNNLRPHILITTGDYIEEQLEVRGWTPENLATSIGISIANTKKLIKNKTPLTTDIAHRLADAFDQTPQYWLNLDALYRQQASEPVQVQ
jgi:antitoxin HigA-1